VSSSSDSTGSDSDSGSSGRSTGDPLLELDEINTYYGDAHILHDLSAEIDEGEVVGLIGRNGAGKTTTLKSIIGLQPPRTGTISFRGEPINGRNPEDIYNRGVGYIPEDRNIFSGLTVRENLLVGLKSGQDPDFDLVFEYFPRLEERIEQQAGTLSGGEQQMLAIARTLVSGPELLLIDEPTEGLMPTLVERISEIIRQLNEDGYTIFLVEQNVDLVLNAADRAYILAQGERKWTGETAELREQEEIIDRYLAV
jgi:branched-chain amino acid transport system ATP-binding protein